LTLDPEARLAHSKLGVIYLLRSDRKAARAEIQQEPSPFWRQFGLALLRQAEGTGREADRLLAEFIEAYQDEDAFQVAELYAYRGDKDRAFEWLERAYHQRDGGLAQITGDPLLAVLRDDPRWPVFLEKMGLPP